LQKAIAAAGVASRRKAEAMIEAGQVSVNGRVVRELGTKVNPQRDEIRVSGTLIRAEAPIILLMNKPDGVVCSAEGEVDDRGRPTVLSLLHGISQRVYPVGRLDFHSRGALIITNDGELTAGLTHPRHSVPKTYHAKFQGHLDEATLDRLREGVTLEDGTVTRGAEEVVVVKQTRANTWVQLTIRQGLNRQVRRMGEAIEHDVLKLIRVAIGDLTIDGLDDGQFRPLRETEIAQLRALIQPPKRNRRRR
jgi:23S rRNA pseudouridine2605 synthase